MDLTGQTIDQRFLIEKAANSSQSIYLAHDKKTKKRVAVCFSKISRNSINSSFLAKIITTGNFSGQNYFVREWVDGSPLDERVAAGMSYPEIVSIMAHLFDFFIKNGSGFTIRPNQVIVLPGSKIKILEIEKSDSFRSLADIYFFLLVGREHRGEQDIPSVENREIKSAKDIKDFRLVDQLFKSALLELKPLPELKKDLVKTSKTFSRKRRRPKIIAGLIALAILGLAGQAFLPKDNKPVQTQKQVLIAPNLVGLKKNQAKKILKKQGIPFVFKVNNKNSSKVLKQKPMPGEPVAGSVTLFIGVKKSEKIKLPNLVGIDREQARQRLQEMGLVAFYERIPVDFRVGLVLKTKPKPGVLIEKNGRVTLFVAAPSGLPEVPDIVGQNIKAARSLAFKKGVGFRVFKKVFTNNYPAGEVIKQRPAPGTRPISKTVKAWVAYPRPDELMPELVGLTVAEARNAIDDLGLSYSLFETNGAPPDFVAKQKPKAGEPLPEKVVKIWIYR